MKNFILKQLKIMTGLMVVTVAAFSITASPVYAATSNCAQADTTAKGQVLQGVGQSGTDCTGTGVTNMVRAVVNILSYVIGVVAVIMIIIAGLKYVASSGDSGRITSAKNTLIYALVGLAIAALAQVLVHYVFSQTTSAANSKAYIGRQVDTA